jgi:hypothetical protein
LPPPLYRFAASALPPPLPLTAASVSALFIGISDKRFSIKNNNHYKSGVITKLTVHRCVTQMVSGKQIV